MRWKNHHPYPQPCTLSHVLATTTEKTSGVFVSPSGRFPPISNEGKPAKKVLAPCGLKDFVCGRASEWISNGTDLCHAAGFSVKPSIDPEELSCYGGKGSVDYVADFWKASQSTLPEETEGLGTLEDFKQLPEATPFSEKVSWAAGGMVLTAGLVFASQSKSRGQRQKQVALQRAARKLGTKVNSRPPTGRENEKRVRDECLSFCYHVNL